MEGRFFDFLTALQLLGLMVSLLGPGALLSVSRPLVRPPDPHSLDFALAREYNADIIAAAVARIDAAEDRAAAEQLARDTVPGFDTCPDDVKRELIDSYVGLAKARQRERIATAFQRRQNSRRP